METVHRLPASTICFAITDRLIHARFSRRISQCPQVTVHELSDVVPPLAIETRSCAVRLGRGSRVFVDPPSERRSIHLDSAQPLLERRFPAREGRDWLHAPSLRVS